MTIADISAGPRPVFRSVWERRLGKTESPIEADFLAGFCVAAVDFGFEVANRSSAHEGTILIYVQKQFGERYRADFLIRYPFFGKEYIAVVECDGHDFHEKTKRQAARDKQRDRICQRLGYHVFRFTGSEIRANPGHCAFEVLDAIMQFQSDVCEKLTVPISELDQ